MTTAINDATLNKAGDIYLLHADADIEIVHLKVAQNEHIIEIFERYSV